MLDALYGALAADPIVRAVWLGGSRARGEADAFSDVDLALDAEGWTPERLGGLWLGGQRITMMGDPFFHGVLADGTILDVRVGAPGEGFVPIHASPHAPPAAEGFAEGPALDFWLNSMKHAKPLARGVGAMTLFGLHHDAMALLRLWALADVGRDPGPGAFTIFGLTPLVRDHLNPARLRLLGPAQGRGGRAARPPPAPCGTPPRRRDGRPRRAGECRTPRAWRPRSGRAGPSKLLNRPPDRNLGARRRGGLRHNRPWPPRSSTDSPSPSSCERS